MRAMRALVLISFVALMWATVALAQNDPPRQGLMWNRTGLPAVFPLQVKTVVGQNYVLLLSDPKSQADVLAAYITGGEFFRVLVPPGTFRIRFASGITWRGEDAMFGRHGQTQVIELPESLTFEVKGLNKKAGQLIDLTTIADGDVAQIPRTDLHICQHFAWEGSEIAAALSRIYRKPLPMWTIRSRYCFPT